MIDGQAADLLGRHVADGAEHASDLGVRRRGLAARSPPRHGVIAGQLRQSEVEDLDAVVRRDEQVLGLEIAMDDPLLVRRREPARDGDGIVDRLAHRQRPGRQPLPERLPFEQLRDDERRASFGADVVDREDVRMVQRRGGACFLLEAVQRSGSAEKDDGQHLDRDVASEPRVARAIHLAHAAGAERGEDFIGPEAHAGG